MQGVDKWGIGQVFCSTRFDESFVVSDIYPVGEQKYDAKGKAKARPMAYEITHIPETTISIMPSGTKWVHTRDSFASNDDIIGKEISLGNWVAVLD